MSSPSQSLVDSVTFGAQPANMGYARFPNGTGEFVNKSPTFNANNENLAVGQFTINDVVIYPNPATSVLNISNAAAL